MSLKKAVFTLLFLVAGLSGFAETGQNNRAIGFQADLFPTAVSIAENKPGYALQAWTGSDKTRIRLIAAHLYMPESLITDGFTGYEINAAAFVIDYVSGSDFSGFWIGPGIELWNSSVKHKSSGQSAHWTDTILTIGCGYIWKFYGNFYIDPWAGIHIRTNNNKITVAGDEFKREKVSFNASLKIGYQINL